MPDRSIPIPSRLGRFSRCFCRNRSRGAPCFSQSVHAAPTHVRLKNGDRAYSGVCLRIGSHPHRCDLASEKTRLPRSED